MPTLTYRALLERLGLDEGLLLAVLERWPQETGGTLGSFGLRGESEEAILEYVRGAVARRCPLCGQPSDHIVDLKPFRQRFLVPRLCETCLQEGMGNVLSLLDDDGRFVLYIFLPLRERRIQDVVVFFEREDAEAAFQAWTGVAHAEAKANPSKVDASRRGTVILERAIVAEWKHGDS